MFWPNALASATDVIGVRYEKAAVTHLECDFQIASKYNLLIDEELPWNEASQFGDKHSPCRVLLQAVQFEQGVILS